MVASGRACGPRPAAVNLDLKNADAFNSRGYSYQVKGNLTNDPAALNNV